MVGTSNQSDPEIPIDKKMGSIHPRYVAKKTRAPGAMTAMTAMTRAPDFLRCNFSVIEI